MFAIYKKELRQYFCSMIGFIFLAFFIAIISIYTWANNFYQGIGNFEITLGSSTFLFVLLVPILSMRIVAEERRQKTDQLLYTAPISLTRIVIGKYLALITLFGLGILFIGFYPLILKHYGPGVSLGAAYNALLGFFLLGAAYISIGTFISSLTESQPIAAVVSFLVLLLSVLLPGMADTIPSDKISQAAILSILCIVVAVISYNMMHSLIVTIVVAVLGEAAVWIVYALHSEWYEGLAVKVLDWLALAKRFDDFSLAVLNLDVVVYYLSISFLFVFLTIQSMKKKRY